MTKIPFHEDTIKATYLLDNLFLSEPQRAMAIEGNVSDLFALRDIYAPLILHIRQRRIPVEQQMLRSRRVWMSHVNRGEFVQRSSSAPGPYTIPHARRAIERLVTRIKKMLLPKSKWFEVKAFDTSLDLSETIAAVDNYMRFLLENHIDIPDIVSQLVRSILLYNLCALKTSPVIKASKIWPSQRAVDPFCFYPFPETASNMEDIELIFEDIFMTKTKYDSFVEKNIALDIKDSDLTSPTWPTHLIERLSYQGFSSPDEVPRSTIEQRLNSLSRGYVALSEVWIPKSEGLFQLWLAWNVGPLPKVVRFQQVKQSQPLYKWAFHRTLPNEAYTNSLMQDIEVLDGLANDQLAQTEDARRIATNPPVGINVSTGGRTETFEYQPRAKWRVDQDPREVFKELNLSDTSTTGLRAFQITLGLINSLAGLGSIAEGQPGRNMPRAGFAVNNLINLGLTDMQEVAETLEKKILTPGLSDIYFITQTFIPKEQIILIPGTQEFPSSKFTMEEITGQYLFSWIGSSQAQESQQRANQLLVFMNLLSTLTPILAKQGYSVNWADLIHMIWTEGLGERGFNKIIQKEGDQNVLNQLTERDGVSSNNNVRGLNNVESFLPSLGLKNNR